jgi:transposase
MKEKRTRKEYDNSFRIQAVKLGTDEVLSAAQVGKNLGINPNNVSRWVRKFSDKGSFPGSGKLTAQDEEIRRLREELRRTTMERDILKKATWYFAQFPK